MSTGADKGLLEEQRAQSVYKHTILNQYLTPFIAKTGQRTQGVVLVDGYAGTGRAGKNLGSGGQMLVAASRMSKKVTTAVYLVEQDTHRFQELDSLAERFRTAGVQVFTANQPVQTQMASILAAARDQSLFLFLDPCGALLDFSEISDPLAARAARRWPPTEAFLNLSGQLTWRASGQLLSRSADQASVQRLDRVVDGTWWRDVVEAAAPQKGEFHGVVETIAAQYTTRLVRATGMKAIRVPVSKKVDGKPIYHLIFLTRNDHGLATFADAIGRARPAWIEAMYPAHQEGTLDLELDTGEPFTPASVAATMAKEEQTAAVDVVEANLRALSVDVSTFSPLNHVADIYGATLGLSTTTQVARALKRLVDDGTLRLVRQHKDPMRRAYERVTHP